MKTVLHVGCGTARLLGTHGFDPEAGWRELRLDIDVHVKPDILASIIDMQGVADKSADVLYTSHTIEHLYPHEVPAALSTFRRVLTDDGYAIIACPDIQSVAAVVAQGKLLEPVYHTRAGIPIAPLDILYGWRSALIRGNLHMAHRSAFTLQVLVRLCQEAGFASIIGIRHKTHYALTVLASVGKRPDEQLKHLLTLHH